MNKGEPELTVVAAFTSVHEAQLAQSVLDAAGIDALLDNEHVISMDWTLSNAVGGVKVLVPADRLEEARQLLETAANVANDDQSLVAATAADDVCKRCGGDAFDSDVPGKRWALLAWFGIGFPIGSIKRRRFCRSCGAPVD